MKTASALIAGLLMTCFCFGDEVVLKNGNRLTGEIVKLDDNKLVLKTDFADTINIKWEAVKSFSSTAPLVLQTADRKIAASNLKREDGRIEINPGSNQPVEIEASSLKSLRSQGEQTAYEKSLNPGLREGWAGGANLGLALATGNSESLSVSTGMNLARSTNHDKISLYSTSVYTKDNVQNAITANAIQGGMRYDRNLTRTMFAFIGGDFEYNDLQKLDIRSTINGGLGYHAINTSRTILDLFGGGSWIHEKYGTGVTNDVFAPSAGQEFAQKLTANTVFKEKAFIYPYVTGEQAGNFRFAFDAGVSTKISRWLSWQTSLSDHYVSNPLPGTKGNDLLLSTGLGLTFAGKK
jgi:putative salt-induced outer membrane protein YdiY